MQRPYIGKSRKEIRDHILSKQIQIKDKDICRGWSVEAADFINKVGNFYFDPRWQIVPRERYFGRFHFS